MPTSDTPATRLATRLGFLVAGYGIACWAPLVPYVQSRLAVDTAVFGLLPVGLAVSAITTIGYAGVLVGPGVIGLVAKAVGLRGAFGLLALLFSCITFFARAATVTEPT
jgi:MFS family permease